MGLDTRTHSALAGGTPARAAEGSGGGEAVVQGHGDRFTLAAGESIIAERQDGAERVVVTNTGRKVRLRGDRITAVLCGAGLGLDQVSRRGRPARRIFNRPFRRLAERLSPVSGRFLR